MAGVAQAAQAGELGPSSHGHCGLCYAPPADTGTGATDVEKRVLHTQNTRSRRGGLADGRDGFEGPFAERGPRISPEVPLVARTPRVHRLRPLWGWSLGTCWVSLASQLLTEAGAL